MTERTDHAEEARNYSDDAETNDGRVIVWGLQDLKESLDALVEQQRIANLIALGQFRVGVDDLPHLRHLVIRPKNEYDIEAVPDIAAALGIEEVQS